MKIRVTVPDAASAKGLVQRLAAAFDPTSVALDADSRDVRIETDQVMNQASRILSMIENWLDEAAVDFAIVSLDGRAHTLAPRTHADRERPMTEGREPGLAIDASERERFATLELENEQLRFALVSRVVIEQAKGVLAERLSLSIEEAFALLRRAARSNRRRIHTLAAEVVGSRETPAEIAYLVPLFRRLNGSAGFPNGNLFGGKGERLPEQAIGAGRDARQ